MFYILFGILFVLDGVTGRFGLSEEQSPTLIVIGGVIVCRGVFGLLKRSTADG